MIIDDEPGIRDTLSDILSMHGFEIICAKDGKEGIEFATKKRPDLIICDIMMPEMDGYGVASHIRKIKDMASIPFIFLTAKATSEDFRFGLRLGVDDYLVKPFDSEEVIETIKMRLGRMEQLTSDSDKWQNSVNYAKTIQKLILPTAQKLKKLFPEHFCIYQPRDIVAGDFYWTHTFEDKIYVAVADCTGHGVPGAMLSMICYEKLNQVMIDFPGLTPAKILGKVNEQLAHFMISNQDRKLLRDGMDIALCMIDYSNENILFSGAARSIYFVTKNEPLSNPKTVRNDNTFLSEIKGDIYSIGASNRDVTFKDNSISFSKGDMIYLFSDGYADQFGGKNDKKFLSAHFKEMILEYSKLDTDDQKDCILKSFHNWKGGNDQTDDVLVMGIRL